MLGKAFEEGILCHLDSCDIANELAELAEKMPPSNPRFVSENPSVTCVSNTAQATVG